MTQVGNSQRQIHDLKKGAPAGIYPVGNRSADTDTFARVHSNARTVHPL